jgi:radical SAM-linked protein
LATIRGVYVPQFFKVHYAAEGNIETIEALLPDYERVEKAIIPDIDQYPFPARQVVPFTELVHDRLVVEISRGCTRGCRFCQAGMIYRPVRERNPETILKDSEKGLALTGFGELSLLSLSSGDYSCIGSLLMALMDRQSRDKIAISLPSLRIDSLDPVWFEQIKRVRKTGFTLAPEVGSDRLRASINKAMTNRDILKMAREVYNAGWNLIKLYFMIGLPGEEDHDLQEIISLAKDVIRSTKGGKKKIKLNVSLSTFVPKSHTPFMWAPQITLEKSRRSIRTIQNALKDRHIRVKWNQPETSWLEGIFSRGDRRLTSALIEAWQMGARFDAWTEHYDMEIWKEALKRTGLEPDFYLYRTRSLDEIFPWDHIESGVSKGYLKNEWERAMAGKSTPDCREHCLECGVCDHKEIDPKLWKNWTPPPKCGTPSREEDPALLKRYCLTFSKTGSARYLSHLEMVRLFIRAFRRAGLHIAHSKGFHPMPKISFAAALPVGMESIHETVNLQIYETTPFSSLKEKINQQLPKGIRITQIEGVTRSGKGPKVKESHYHINMDGVKVEQETLEKFLKSTDFSIIKKTKKGEKMIDARRLVKSIGLVPPHDLDMVINHTDGPSLRPLDIVKEIFHLDDHQVEVIKILKVRQVMD